MSVNQATIVISHDSAFLPFKFTMSVVPRFSAGLTANRFAYCIANAKRSFSSNMRLLFIGFCASNSEIARIQKDRKSYGI